MEVAPGTGLPAVAAELLARVAPQIRASRRLRILPWGELDYHALPFDGAPLLAAAPLVYGVDVGPGRHRPEGPEPAPRTALLVGDPLNLKWARTEIEFAAATLGHRPGVAVEKRMLGRDATAQQVRDRLVRTDFFHFAGHGEFAPAGSQSRLLLADGDLSAADLFTLKKVPNQVLLASCSVGQAARASGVEGLGLAYSFVLAGSRQVVAATRQVNDLYTAQLSHLIYEQLEGHPGELDLAVALQEAQLELRRRDPSDAWQAFRAFEP